MSGFIAKMSRLGCYNLLAFVIIAALPVCLATTPKPINNTRRGLPEPEFDLEEQQREISKILTKTNLTSLENKIPDPLETASTTTSSSSRKSEDQEAAPSVTSVHQVWTSSSSGSLEELSPEVISKLRQDVPFLAAYALRPRLVGATGNNQHQFTSSLQSPMSANLLDTANQDQAPMKSSGERTLLTSASSPQVSQSGVLGPRLGDISEYRVETSSSSKSEHHHNRKTTLKKKTDEELEAKRRKVLAASQLVKRRSSRVKKKPSRKSYSGRKLSRGKASRARSGKRNRKGKKRSQARTSRLRQKSGNRSARYFQTSSSADQPLNEIDGDTGRAKMELESRSIGEQTTTLVDNGVGGTKGGDERGTKGGSGIDRSKQRPFYARTKPNSDNPEEVGEDQPANSSAEGVSTNKSNSDEESAIDSNPTDDSGDNSEEVDGAEAGDSEPRRVGDEDVEEEGDTVTVMPKSDGVDDDPDINDAPPGAAPEEEADLNPPERERENGDSSSENDLEEEPRTRRINRERPNQSPRADGGQSGERATADNDAATGGGIGATTGGASTGNSGRDDAISMPDRDSPDKAESDDLPNVTDTSIETDDSTGSMNDGKSVGGSENDSSSGDSEKGQSGDQPDKRPSSSSNDSDSSNDADQRGAEEFDSERSNSRDVSDRDESDSRSDRARPTSNSGTSAPKAEGAATNGEDDAGDVDYRDEMAEAERKRHQGGRKSESGRGEGEATSHERGKGSDKKECDDGSYDHHSDHHGDHHHDHQNSIEWLRGAIPGEPGVDYPTLSGVNKTDFNCREQKYPGYYADVDSRCQIFHICQADGRQDSFICPNGTIFSQITTVCVWWNSFDCEDAPKYYALNALLYKTPASHNKNSPSTSDLRPRDGARLEPNVRGVERVGGSSSEESSIDDLIRAMRRSKGVTDAEEKQPGVTYDSSKKAGTTRSSSSFGADDEATIQRKSTNLDDDSELISSRLRSKVEPRRKRRASVKQAPPKLKSRRVSRNSRRRKLRHGIKPKRRA